MLIVTISGGLEQGWSNGSTLTMIVLLAKNIRNLISRIQNKTIQKMYMIFDQQFVESQ